MPQLSQKLDWPLANPLWASLLNPVLSNPLLQGKMIKSTVLVNGTTVIPHGLQRNPVGWFCTDINGSATIFRAAPFNDISLTLTSSALVTVSIWIF